MRTYDEMFQRVLVRRDAYRAAQAVRRQKIRYSAMISSAAVMCGLLIAAGMQLGSPQHIPTAPTVMDMTTETTQTTVTERVTETNGTIPAEHTTDVPASETLPAETDTIASENTEFPETQEIPTGTQPVMNEQTPPLPPQTDAPATQPESTETATAAIHDTVPDETVPDEPEIIGEQDGFRIEKRAGSQIIRCMEDFPAPTGTLRTCTLDSEMLELVEVRTLESAAPVNEYRIRPIGQETEFIVTQQEYESFEMTVDADAQISISLGGKRGFFVLSGDTCTLCWFADSEGFTVSGDSSDLKYLLEISRKLVYTEN